MAAAIEIYNKPGIPYRNESFTILAINGWELLLKARWLNLHDNKRRALYVYTMKGGRRRIKRTRSGSPFTHDLVYLAKCLLSKKELHRSVLTNLEVMLAFRDAAIHFFNSSKEFETKLYEIGAACVRNFIHVIHSWFQRDVTELNQHIMPLTFISLPSTTTASFLNAEERGFVSFLKNIDTSDADLESPYQVSLNVEIRFVRSKSVDATPVRISGHSSAIPVRLSEEDIRERYPLNYDELTEKCKKRYRNFKINGRYHDIRRSLQADQRYVHCRFLDPGSPKSVKKFLFSGTIFEELDRYYSRG